MLRPSEIVGLLQNWASLKMSLNENDIFIKELQFSNKLPNENIDSTFRADLALANGRLVGFEIKSFFDSLGRWEGQLEAYNNVFDEVWLCAHGRHIYKALDITPKKIGVILVDDDGRLAVLRNALPNRSNNSFDLTGFFWREELLEICRKYDINVKSKNTKSEIRHLICEALDKGVIQQHVLSTLKNRFSV